MQKCSICQMIYEWNIKVFHEEFSSNFYDNVILD